jgi:hypothetical protein
MFTLIRGVIIIGLIFYLSPVRHTGAPERQPPDGERTPVPPTSSRSPEVAKTEDGLWNRMVGSFAEEAVRTAVTSKAQDAGLRLKDHAPWALSDLSTKPASTGTLRSPDRDAERASPGVSVRCVYRCDGAE